MATILVIDDDFTLRELVRNILEKEGHQVVEALNSEEGVALYREKPAELVITDIFMPGRDGLGTVEKFRRDDPEVKIIAMTGHGEKEGNEFLRIARSLGANRTLSKPFSPDELVKTVKDLLEERA